MIALTKFDLTKKQLERLLFNFSTPEFELEWDYSDEGKNQGTLRCNDFLIECDEFDIEVDLFVQLEGYTTTYSQSADFIRTALDVEVGTIKLIPDDCSEVSITAGQYQAIKNKIINNINNAL